MLAIHSVIFETFACGNKEKKDYNAFASIYTWSAFDGGGGVIKLFINCMLWNTYLTVSSSWV